MQDNVTSTAASAPDSAAATCGFSAGATRVFGMSMIMTITTTTRERGASG